MIEVCVVGELNLDLILYGLPKDLVLQDREHLASGHVLHSGKFFGDLCAQLVGAGNARSASYRKWRRRSGEDGGGAAIRRRAWTSARMKQGTGKTSTGLTVVLPHTQHRYILTYPGTMSEMQFSDIDMDYVRSARHLHLSSFFLHRALRPANSGLVPRSQASRPDHVAGYQ